MTLREVRRRLPVVESLPPGRGRRVLPPPRGAVQRPALAVWEFTRACDQRCQACGPRAGTARADELTTEEALRLVDELAELGVGEVALIGGEAYLRADGPGLMCANPELGDECDPLAIGCCLPFCDTDEIGGCTGAGAECLPWFEEGTAPAGLEDVGVCGLPS